MSIRVGLRSMGRALGEIIIDEWLKAANIFSAYNVCSTIPFEKLTAQLSSTYTACIEQKEYLISSLVSTYSIGTAPT